jgi:hypothetical protein
MTYFPFSMCHSFDCSVTEFASGHYEFPALADEKSSVVWSSWRLRQSAWRIGAPLSSLPRD